MEGHLEDERVRNQLRHILVEEELRLFDKPAMVGNHEDVPWQLHVMLHASEVAEVLEHDLLQHRVLVVDGLLPPL